MGFDFRQWLRRPRQLEAIAAAFVMCALGAKRHTMDLHGDLTVDFFSNVSVGRECHDTEGPRICESSMTQPFWGYYDGESIVPSDKYNKALCHRQFALGEICRFVQDEPRTGKEHRHMFAVINTAWKTLPEKFDGKWEDVEHFRKWLLIQAKYCDVYQCASSTPEDAQQIGAFVSMLMKQRGEYAIVTVDKNLVTALTAKSMKKSEMKTKLFRSVKRDVLDMLVAMTGISLKKLEAEADASLKRNKTS